MFSDLEDLEEENIDIICFAICERVCNQSPLTLEQHGGLGAPTFEAVGNLSVIYDWPSKSMLPLYLWFHIHIPHPAGLGWYIRI